MSEQFFENGTPCIQMMYICANQDKNNENMQVLVLQSKQNVLPLGWRGQFLGLTLRHQETAFFWRTIYLYHQFGTNLSSLGKTNRKTKTETLHTSIIPPLLTSAPFIYPSTKQIMQYILSATYKQLHRIDRCLAIIQNCDYLGISINHFLWRSSLRAPPQS